MGWQFHRCTPLRLDTRTDGPTHLTLLYDTAVVPVKVLTRGAQVDAVVRVELIEALQQGLNPSLLVLIERLQRPTRAQATDKHLTLWLSPITLHRQTPHFVTFTDHTTQTNTSLCDFHRSDYTDKHLTLWLSLITLHRQTPHFVTLTDHTTQTNTSLCDFPRSHYTDKHLTLWL